MQEKPNIKIYCEAIEVDYLNKIGAVASMFINDVNKTKVLALL